MIQRFQRIDKALERLEQQERGKIRRNYDSARKDVRQLVQDLFNTAGTYEAAQKYGRLNKLEKKITERVGKLTGQNASTIKGTLRNVFQESYYRTQHAIDNEAQSRIIKSKLLPKVIEESIENPLDRVGFLQRNRDNQRQMTRQLKERITQGLVQGKAFRDVAGEINERFGIGEYNAMRIVQTESHRVQQQAKQRSFEDSEKAGVNMVKVWVSTLDGDTRDTHQDLDGQKVPIDGMFTSDGDQASEPGGFSDPAQTINCRCTMRAEIEGFEPRVRRAREEGIRPQTNYNDWVAELDD